MHRVYNSAFMHMLRDEDNAGYRKVLKETLEFDPEILKRYVNFMNNPDEKSAAEQFGKGDKYVGVATLLATLPGLPMFGHGQFEGFAEKYGMEFRRASMDEQPDHWLIERHEREIVPLLHRRGDFAEARDFLLYDVAADGGGRRRARVRVLERVGAVALAGRLPQPVCRDLGLDPGLGRVRAQGGRRVEVDGAPDAGGRAWAWRDGSGRRPMARDARAAVRARVPAVRARDPRARRARLAARLRDAGVLGAARAVRRGRRLGPARGTARRARRAVARGRAARARAHPGARRAPGGDRGAVATDGRAARRRRRGRDGDGGRPGGGGRPRRGAARVDRGRRRRDRRSVAGVGDAALDAARAARVAARRRRRRGDEPGVVRGAAAGAGRGRRRSATAASTRPAHGGPPSGSGCCSRWRSRRSWAAAPRPCRRGSSTRGSPIRRCARSCASTAGTAPTGSTASRGRSSSPGPTAWSGC